VNDHRHEGDDNDTAPPSEATAPPSKATPSVTWACKVVAATKRCYEDPDGLPATKHRLLCD